MNLITHWTAYVSKKQQSVYGLSGLLEFRKYNFSLKVTEETLERHGTFYSGKKIAQNGQQRFSNYLLFNYLQLNFTVEVVHEF